VQKRGEGEIRHKQKVPLEKESFQKEGSNEGMKKRKKGEGREGGKQGRRKEERGREIFLCNGWEHYVPYIIKGAFVDFL
jgi:hypothetical protein